MTRCVVMFRVGIYWKHTHTHTHTRTHTKKNNNTRLTYRLRQYTYRSHIGATWFSVALTDTSGGGGQCQPLLWSINMHECVAPRCIIHRVLGPSIPTARRDRAVFSPAGKAARMVMYCPAAVRDSRKPSSCVEYCLLVFQSDSQCLKSYFFLNFYLVSPTGRYFCK